MKHTLTVLFIAVLILSSCDEPESSTMFALVSGTQWTATYVNFSIEDSMLIIYGEDENLGDIISLNLKPFRGIGTFSLGNASAAVYRDAEGDVCIICEEPTVYAAYSGEVEITHYDTASVRGNFYFRAQSPTTDDDVSITFGKFDLIPE